MNDVLVITHALGGQYTGRYGRASCPVCQYATHPNPSLSIAVGQNGRLLLRCFKGCDYPSIVEALSPKGIIDRGGPIRFNGCRSSSHDAANLAHDMKRSEQAERCWNEAQEINGTIAEAYLRRRHILCDMSDALRFHPKCWHAGTAKPLPAMVARIVGGERFAIHRTYLTPDGRKAKALPAKMMLGPCRGGAVRVSDGDGPLVVAEGIETALSLASGLFSGPATVWAALSTSGVAGLELPSKPGRLTIAPDGDDAGAKAAHQLATRADALGWKVSLLPAPLGKDWNDVLMGRASQ